MAKLTNAQRRELETILGNLRRAQDYIRKEQTVIGLKYPGPDGAKGGTTLDYRRADGGRVAELNKEIGSDITGLHTAVYELSCFLDNK